MTLTVTDLFCGAGGSSLGAESVPNVQLAMAANHWPKAIETHQANFPNAAHDCADISQVDFRRYRRSDILLASPECTNHTAAKGVSRRAQHSTLFDLGDQSAIRSRATMWDVHRYIEVHRPAAVIVENVIEAAAWIYWAQWWSAFEAAGYEARVLSINSMHVPGRVPQSRDRIYVVATRKGVTPDLHLRPAAECPRCGGVNAVQTFKRAARIAGRYKQSYVYRCPTCMDQVFPPEAPALEALDWTLPGQRIGDRARPLAPATLRRIQTGLEHWGISTRSNETVRAASGDTPLVAGPAWYVSGFSQRGNECMVHPVSQPLGTITAHDTTALLVPYYSQGRATSVNSPVPTVSTRDRFGLLEPEVNLADCRFRMLEPHEVGRAMAFPVSYQVNGSKRTRVKLYGNAVTPPVMAWIVARVVRALEAM